MPLPIPVWTRFSSSYYAFLFPDAKAEKFPSLRAAKREFRRRYNGENPLFPVTDDGCEMYLYFGGPYQEYPDAVFCIGPRGGIRTELL